MLNIEKRESGPVWADKTATLYSEQSITNARKWAEEQMLGGDADRTVERWAEFIATLDADQATVFSILLNRKLSRDSRMAALDILINEFLKDETNAEAIAFDAEQYLEVGR